jgi:hypothetical protein
MKQEEIMQEIDAIKARNKKVEAEKTWETSWQRRVLILLITYIFMVFFMNLIGVKWVFVNAMIPTFGFYLSTLSVGFLKKKFIQKYLETK